MVGPRVHSGCCWRRLAVLCRVAEQLQPDLDDLRRLVTWRMPFGRYAGMLLTDLPEPYLVWFAGKGFPPGKLGEMMRTAYEIKLNGLEPLIDELRADILGEARRARGEGARRPRGRS